VDQLVAWYDADASRFFLTGWLSGPAGSAAVELADGRIVVDVDYASPGTISHIEVGAAYPFADDVAASLAALTGVPYLATRLRDVDETPRVVWARERAGSRPEMHVAGPVGRLALLLAEHRNPRRSGRAHGAAALEAANLIGDLDPALQVTHPPLPLWSEAARLLDAMDPVPDGPLSRALRIAAGRSAPVDPDLSRQLSRLAETAAPRSTRLASMAADDPAANLAAFGMRRGEIQLRTSVRRSRKALDMPVEVAPDLDVSPSVSTLHDGVVRVGATGTRAASPPLYLRVFRNARVPVPLAVVPFVPTRFDSANATAVVPRDLARDDLLVEVTVTPEALPLLPSVRRFGRAIRIGQDASRLTRRGSEISAAAEWERDALEWRGLGDDRRANLAARFAEGNQDPYRSPRRRVRQLLPTDVPLLSDLVE
jgi:hypothetical protein